ARYAVGRSSPPRRRQGPACTSPGPGTSSTDRGITKGDHEERAHSRRARRRRRRQGGPQETGGRPGRGGAGEKAGGGGRAGRTRVGGGAGGGRVDNAKHRDGVGVGSGDIRRELAADARQAQVEAVNDELNENPECTGYLVQLPLPPGLDALAILHRMDPAKD